VADWLAVVLVPAEGFAARALAYPGMPGADRECGEADGQEGDEDAGPADQRLVGGEAREEDGDPGGAERGSATAPSLEAD